MVVERVKRPKKVNLKDNYVSCYRDHRSLTTKFQKFVHWKACYANCLSKCNNYYSFVDRRFGEKLPKVPRVRRIGFWQMKRK